MAWALMERPPTRRFLEESHEGSVEIVFRLLTIPDFTALDLYYGFVDLTGMEPRFRSTLDWDPEFMQAEWQEIMGAHISPQLARVGG